MATATTSSVKEQILARGFGPLAKPQQSAQKKMQRFGEIVASKIPRLKVVVCFVAAISMAILSMSSGAQTPSDDPQPTPRIAPITAWQITPELSVTESFTDNAALLPAATAKKSWVTESTPGIRIEKLGVRSRLFFDYRLSHFRYVSDSQLDNSQRLLNSYATIEAIDNWLYLDASANITQQNRSAFSIAASTTASGPSGNRVETATNQISPHVRGRLGGIATYQLRFVGADIRSDDAALPDTRGKQWNGFLKNQRASSGFGWSVDGNALSFRNAVVGRSHDARVRGSVSYEVTPQIHLSAIVGHEVTNFAGLRSDAANTSGLGVEWSPSSRTQFAAVVERRFFGDSHSMSVTHRTPRSAWRLTSTRDITALAGQLTSSGPGTTAGLLSDLLVSAIPDPVAREAAVRQRLEDSGIATNSALNGGFATGRPFLIRSDEGSVVLTGIYNTVTITFSRRDQRGLGPATVGIPDSFSLSNDIRRQGMDLNWAYRLSPRSSLTFAATSLRSEGRSTTGLDTSQRTLNVLFTTRLGQNTFASLGARRVQFDNQLNTGYRENVVLGSVSLRY